MPARLQETGLKSRIFSYGYNSGTAFSKAVTGITDEAAMLLDRIKGERRSQSDRRTPIIFIAHSLGGILVKKVGFMSQFLLNLSVLSAVSRALHCRPRSFTDWDFRP